MCLFFYISAIQLFCLYSHVYTTFKLHTHHSVVPRYIYNIIIVTHDTHAWISYYYALHAALPVGAWEFCSYSKHHAHIYLCVCLCFEYNKAERQRGGRHIILYNICIYMQSAQTRWCSSRFVRAQLGENN